MNAYVNMPQMGESVTEGTVTRWLKKPGDAVARDEAILEISTDKVDTEVPSPVSGVLAKMLAREGATLPVGAPLAEIETADNVPAPAKADSGHFKTTGNELVHFSRPSGIAAAQAVAPVSGQAAARSATAGGARSYSPSVMRAALSAGLTLKDLDSITGTGFHGRVLPTDVEREARAKPASASRGALEKPAWLQPAIEDSDTIVTMTPVRQRIAEHMMWSRRLAAHATAFTDVDMSAIVALKQPGVSYLAFFAGAVVPLLKQYPVFNASVLDDGRILQKGTVHLGIAVAVDEDLFVPVIHAADELSFSGLARAIAELTAKARERKLTIDDLRGGTFTITNPGTFGGVSGTPIIHQPQVAILGLGAIVRKPAVVEDALAIRPTMSLSLSFDHRVIDGALGFRFLEELRRRLETFVAG